MFLYKQGRRQRGFTLVELAIVMGVVGVMSAGLWRLMATGNQQTKDQAAAQQQQQVIAAVQGFLMDAQGQADMQAMNANSTATLSLTCSGGGFVGAAPVTALSNTNLCNYLPTGWQNINAYGQTFSVQVLKDNTIATVLPVTYSFMVVASDPAVTVPDADGGRISGLIGGDGGFIYSTPVCTAAANPKAACGTLGAWQDLDITTTGADYKFPAANVKVGSIVSRTAVLPTPSSNNWLSRSQMPGDPTFRYNSMLNGSLYLNTVGAAGGPNGLFLGTSAAGVVTGGGNVHLQGGTVLAEGTGPAPGTIDLGNFGQIIGTSGGNYGAQIALTENTAINNANHITGAPALSITDSNPTNASCSATSPCSNNIVTIIGNVGITGQLAATSLFASNIMYNSDKRLKKDITPLPHALDDIMQITPVSFVFKSNGTKTLGVIAQNVQQVYPQLVGKDPKGYLSVAYSGLIAPLIGSVQELKKENEELRTLLQAQAERQNKMQQELDALKEQQ